MTRPSRAVADWTLRLARGESLPRVPLSAQNALEGQLVRHGLAPLASARVRQTQAPFSQRLRPYFEQAVGHHLRTRADLAELVAAFANADVAWAVLKGPVIAELAHPLPGARPYADLDVLVAATQLRRAVEVMQSVGWVMQDRNHPLLLALLPGEVHLLSPRGVQCDLHWSVMNMSRTRAAFPTRAAALLERRRDVIIGRHRVPTLQPDAFLVHVCLHAALSGADRLLMLLDVDQLVRRADTTWSGVVDVARSWGAATATAVTLGRASRLLGTPVPRQVLRELVGPGWRATTAAVDVVAPVHRSGAGGSWGRIVARSSRADETRSWAELGHRITARLRRPAAEVGSVFDDVPDPASLEAFFQLVARQG